MAEPVQAEVETTARCAWCGGVALPGQGRLAVCPRCGAATTWPRPQEDELERAYGTWYRPSSGRFAAGGDQVLRISRASLARRLDRIAPPGPVLDVGAGEGALVGALRKRGRDTLGIERAAGPPGVIGADITQFQERAGEWSAVVFWHSLEHLPDPARAVDRACELLRPGGVLVIAVPNLASWQSWAFGLGWFHLDLPRHVVHLSAPALTEGVTRRGLRIERLSYWRGGQLVFGWLYGLVAAMPGGLDLYSAIRRLEARGRAIDGRRRALAVGAATALTPVAAALTVGEVAARAGGTVYLEARRP